MTDEERVDLAEQIAVGMHTGLRKGSEAPSSAGLWRAISESTDSAWMDAARFCVAGLEQMGYELVTASSWECPAYVAHGPGHQSRTRCTIKTPHPLDGEHEVLDIVYSWEGEVEVAPVEVAW